MQDGRTFDFTRKKQLECHLGKSTYEKNMLAIMHEKYISHPYIFWKLFQIKIDHRSLKYFLGKKISSPEK
jgi:hypothetical protein